MSTHDDENHSGLANGQKRRFLGTLIFAFLTGLVAFVPVVFSTITYDAAYLKRTILELFVITGLLVWTIKIGVSGQRTVFRSRMNTAVMVLWIAAFFSFAVSFDRSLSVIPLWRITVFVALYFLTVTFCDTRRKILTVLSTAVWISIPICIYGIIQYFDKDPIPWAESTYLRIWSSIGNPSSFAGYLLIIIPVALSLTILHRSLLQKIASVTALMLSLVALYMTKTKGAWLSLIAGVLLFSVLYWLAKRKYPTKWSRKNKIAVLLALVVLLSAITPGIIKATGYFQGTISSSMEVRIFFWRVSTKMFLDHPIIGTGIGTFQKYFPQYRSPSFRTAGVSYNTLHAHNEYIETLVEQGIIGFAALFWLLFFLLLTSMQLFRSIQTKRDWWLVSGITVSVFMTLAHNMTNVTHRWVVCPTFFWIFLAMIAILQTGFSNNFRQDQKVVKNLWQRIFFLLLIIPMILICGLKFSVNPTLSQIELQNGAKQIFKQHYFQVIYDLKKSIQYNRLQFDAYYKLGYAYDALGNRDKALKMYLELQQLMPSYAQTQLNIAMLLIKQEKWKEAHRALLKAARNGIIHPKFVDSPSLKKVRNSPEGEDVYGKVLKWMTNTDSRNMFSWYALGMWHYHNDRLEEARTTLKRALHIHDMYINALYHLAVIQYRTENKMEAVDLWNTVLTKRPHSAQTYFNIGLVHLQMYEFETARKMWSKALSTDRKKDKKDPFERIVFIENQ